MKKIYSLLLLAVALLCLPMGVKGETLTVANGSSLRQQLPVFGYNCDGAQHNQFIYLASELSDMNGGEITALKFYLEKQSYTWSSNGAPVATFRFAEVEATTVSSLISVDETFTQVDSKQIVFASGEWIVELTTPYQYKGGNLLVDVQTPAAGYVNSNSNTGSRFYSAEADYRGNYNGTVQYYVPKITFTYEEAAAEGACNKPKNLTLSEELPDGATFTWEQNADETTYQWACVAAGAEVETWNSLEENVRTKTITGLTAGTSYDFYVRSYCGSGEDEQSAGVKKNFTPTCPAPTYPTTPVTDITANSVTVTWNAVDGITKYQSVCVLKNATPDWADVEAKESLTAELTELTASTEYDFYVRSYYSATSQSSAVKTSFKTACGVAALPFSEDFSSALDCWTMESCHSSTGIYSSAFRFNYSTNPPQYLVSPELAVSEKEVKVTFQYKAESSSYPETFQVGYSTTTKDLASAFTWSETITSTNTSYADYEQIVPAGVKYIAIKYTANNQYYLYIDNFSATEYVAPACAVPTGLAASEITANSAKIAWTSEAEAWKLQTSADGENWSDVAGEITNPYVLTGLTANTKYYVRVCANCGANGDSEWTAAINFTTECETATLPFGPESFSEGKLPGCWSAASQWAIYPYDGNSMRFNASTTADLTLPAIALSDKAQLTFRRQSSYVSCSVYVNDGENETKLADFEKSSSWAQSTVDLSAYAGKTVTIIIRGNYYASSRYLYIDDVAVSYKPVAAPTNLAAAPANASAVITWECDEEDATYTLRYRANGGEGEWTEVADLTAKTYTIESLTNGTAYEVQVKAIASANRLSDWTASAVVTPQACPTITGIELSEKTYNSVKVSWTTSGAGTWTLQYGVNPSMTIVNDLTATEYVLTNLSAGQTYTISVVPTCSEDAQQTTYTPVYTAPANAAVASITDAAATASWEAVADAPNGYKYVVVAKDATPDWHSEAVKATSELTASLTGLDALTEYDFYVAALYGETLSPATKASFTTTTVAPKNLTAGEITTTTATFTWENDGAATQYQWSTDNTNWSDAQAELTATATGLNAGTAYTFYVRSYYAEGKYSAAISKAFSTECATVAIGWSEDFGTVAETKPNCWNIANWGTSANSWTTAGDFAKTGVALRYNARTMSSAEAITPSIEITDKCKLTFYIKNSVGNNSAKVECKVLVNDGTATTEIADITTRYTTATLQTLDLSAYAGKTVTIIFRGIGYDTSGSPYLWIDDIAVSYKPVAAPTNLTATPDDASAVVAWESTEEGATYTLQYRATGAEEWTLVENLTEKTYTITGLTNGTEYEVQVKAVASANRQSEWTAAVGFTPVACPEVTAVTFGAKTYNSVVVNWTATANSTWSLRYKTDGDWTVISPIAEQSKQLTGLSTGATYTIEVKAVCGGEETWVAAEETVTLAYTAPASAAVASITDIAAEATWTAVSDATGYEYVLLAEGEPDWSEAVATDETSASLSGLAAGTDYTLYVRSVYPTGYSEPVEQAFATITIAPKNLAQDGASTTTTATFTWEANGAATQYQWSVDGENWSEAQTALTATAEGLTAGTAYTFYVRSYYSESVQSAAISKAFSTECAVVAMPFTPSFEEGVPTCWTSTGSWTVNTEYSHSGYSIRCEAKNKTGLLTTPTIDITAEDAVLIFFLRNIYGGSNYVSGKVIITPEVGEATEVAFANASDFTKQVIDLSSFYGTQVTVSFSVSSVSSTAYVFIDDVQVIPMPCVAPTGLTAIANTHASATLSWTAGDDEEAWQIQYKAADAEEWTLVSGIDVTSYQLTELTGSITYMARVRAYCDATHQSEWSESVEFTTPNDPSGIGNVNDEKADGEWTKTLRNGVLLIEKNGVKYNAQGQKIN